MALQKSEQVRKEVIALMRRFFGDETADLYKNFFQDDDEQSLLESARELLTEAFGEKKAEEALSNITRTG